MALEYELREFTVDEYHRMAEAGILRPEERVELLDGRLVRMSAIGYRHSGVHMSITAYLQRRLPDAAIAGQASFSLRTRSEPQPDIAILAQARDVYLRRPAAPGELLVVIEIAESSLAKDLGPKRALYARYRVPEYLVIDVDRNVLLYHAAPNDMGYADESTLAHGDTLTLRAFPRAPLSVSELFFRSNATRYAADGRAWPPRGELPAAEKRAACPKRSSSPAIRTRAARCRF